MKKITGYLFTLHDRINYRGMVEQQITFNKVKSYSYSQFYPYDVWDSNWWTADDWNLSLNF